MSRDFRYLVKKIHKEYDTAELLAEKKKIDADLHYSQWSGIIYKSAIALLLVIVGYLVWRHIRLKRRHRERFEELLNSTGGIAGDIPREPVPLPDINPQIVQHILVKLANFENKNGFLKKDLTAGKLAEAFDTNYKYLSRVIRSHRDKSFVNYINDLRVDYIIDRLKNEHLLRNYTNGALADEAGFSTAQHFVTAFKKRAKLSPGYFVEELNKIGLEEHSIES